MVIPDLVVRTNRKSLSLIINKDGKLIIRAPKRLSMDKIINFVHEKEKWILMKQSQVNETKSKFEDVRQNQSILFLGKKYKIRFVDGVKKIEIVDDSLLCPINLNNSELFINKLIKWFYASCKEIITSRYNYFVELMQIDANNLKIIDSKAKWGSCDNFANIKLNYRTIMLPHNIIDYIIIHELCHVIELNHSDRFYKLIECVMPNYKIYKKKLREYNFLLNLYR